MRRDVGGSIGRTLRLPDFLCIGAMRCGTTTLWDLLVRHERVFEPATKEIHFFDDRDGAFGRGLDWYGAHFEGASNGDLCGECSPSYLFVEGTAERIARVLPSVRLVAILRNPVDRAWSHYWFMVRMGREPLGFEEALDREQERLATGDPNSVLWYSYAARGRYVEQLRRYETTFGREALQVILLDDLLAEPGTVMRSVFGHLSLNAPASPPVMPSRNPGLYPRSRRLHVVMRRAKRWSEGRNVLVRQAVRAAFVAPRRLNVTAVPPRMPVGTRTRLEEAFCADNEALAAWLGRELPWGRTLAAPASQRSSARRRPR